MFEGTKKSEETGMKSKLFALFGRKIHLFVRYICIFHFFLLSLRAN